MQALGGEWNAFTSNADTTFVIEAPAKNQRKVLDLLLALLTQTRIDDNSINAAKQVVEREEGGHYTHLQRWLDRQDLGHTASNQLAVELGLKCPERPEVDYLTREQLETVRKAWYAPNNMTLSWSATSTACCRLIWSGPMARLSRSSLAITRPCRTSRPAPPTSVR